jgi:hypothetical protein
MPVHVYMILIPYMLYSNARLAQDVRTTTLTPTQDKINESSPHTYTPTSSTYMVYGSCFHVTLLSSLMRSNLTTLCNSTCAPSAQSSSLQNSAGL